MNPTLQTLRPLDGHARPFRAAQPDFTPVAAKAMSPAEAALESPFQPPLGDLVSFLVNGLYLIGSHRILEWDSADAGIAAALEDLGHRVTRGPGPDVAAGSFERAMLVSRAFGYGGDEADRLWLKAMHRALQPGGLLLFHVLDRDRAWSLVRDFLTQAGPGAVRTAGAVGVTGAAAGGAKADIAFDPGSGKVTARIRPAGIHGSWQGRAGRAASVRAFNLGEIRSLLAETGFTLERAYGDWHGGALEDAGERTGRILVAASKNRRPGRGSRSGAGNRTGAGKRGTP